LTGSWCDYRLYFVWQEDLGAVYFSCLFDVRIPPNKRAGAYHLLALINEKLWLGHFDLCSEELVPMFRRHTLLVRGTGHVSAEQFEGRGRYRLQRMRALLPGLSVRAVGR